mgnify:CR=1 FL=1
MKNLIALSTFTSAILLSIPAGKFILKVFNPENRKMEIEKSDVKNFDDSLRNFHPNKGE